MRVAAVQLESACERNFLRAHARRKRNLQIMMRSGWPDALSALASNKSEENNNKYHAIL